MANRNKLGLKAHLARTEKLVFKVLLQWSGEERAGEWLRDGAGHVGIVNVWRPTMNSVEKSPLGIMDIGSYDDQVNYCHLQL